MIRWLGRSIGILLALLILLATPCAFWTFNLERVALNSQTYTDALRAQHFYDGLVPALVDGAAADTNVDPAVKAYLNALLNNLTVEDWAQISALLLPPSWVQTQMESNITRFFDWLNGTSVTPGVQFDLKPVKRNFTADKVDSVVQIVMAKLPTCTADEENKLKAVAGETAAGVILCNPAANDVREKVVNALGSSLVNLGDKLPEQWDLVEQLRKAEPNPRGRFTEFDLAQFRAFVQLQSRLSVLLFLIPLALLSIIVIVTVRSGKEFFRWTGWVLVLSGLITLIPVPFYPAWLGGLAAGPGVENGFGENGQIMMVLIGGMVTSLTTALTLAVLIQVAVVIVLGLIAVGASILLPAPPPDVSRKDVAREAALAAQQASYTPPGTAFQTSGTPAFGRTPPPTPATSNDDWTIPPSQ
ncbi:MAG: hypothetical protein IT324_08475 [Anaerolineae bacterium]|nr:hypothetical protein [Anaerolineae bacterium]